MKQITVFLCVILLASCEWRHPFEFYIEIENDANGRSLLFFVPPPIDQCDTSQWIKPFELSDTAKYSCAWSNIYNYKPFDKVKVHSLRIHKVMPYYFHRSVGGATDTLYANYGLGIGYVSRYYADKKWFVIEIKRPGLIHGYEDLVDSASFSKPLIDINLVDYTYEGQKKIFDSNISDFWIVARKSRDLYGPFTEKQVIEEIPKLGIKLPIRLKFYTDYYALIQHYSEEYPFKIRDKSKGKRPDKILKLIP